MNTIAKTPPVFSIGTCYAHAWKAFSKWWIPLCAISGAVFFINILPRLLTKSMVADVYSHVKAVLFAIGDPILLDARLQILIESLIDLGNTTLRYTLVLFPIGIFLSTLLLLFAIFAVNNEKQKKPIRSFIWVATARLSMALIKAVAFFCFILPGIYLYIKLFFVPLYMFEKQEGMWQAMKSSWRLTDGYFWELLLLVCLNIMVQTSASATIIGVIPVFGFVNTVRAAAFRMLLGERMDEVTDVDTIEMELEAEA